MVSAQITVKQKLQRLWDCGWDPKKYRCSSEEISRSRKWLIGAPPAVLAALLLAAGITVKAYKVKKAQSAKQKEIDTKIAELSAQWKRINTKVQKIVSKIAQLKQEQNEDTETKIAGKELMKQRLELQKGRIGEEIKNLQKQK